MYRLIMHQYASHLAIQIMWTWVDGVSLTWSLVLFRIREELPTLTALTRALCLSPGRHLLREVDMWTFDLLLSSNG